MSKSLRKSIIYNNLLIDLVSEFKYKKLTREYHKKVVFYGIKTLILFPMDKETTYTEVINVFNCINFVKDSISKLTINEFENIFPIQKIYDGDRWECKDYFYTKEYLKTIENKDFIGKENVEELLWEYVNTEIRLFNSLCFTIVDKLRRFDGEVSLMEEWANKNNITTYTLKKDSKGKEYLYNKKNGKSLKIKKRFPRYLKLIKKTAN